jgi:hypothetical protein
MAGNRIIVHVAGTQAGRVEIDVHPLFLPPLVYEDDVLVIPHNFCGIRIRKAGEFLWLNASGQLVEAENHGDVLKMGEEYYLGGIEFTGLINSCQQNHPWYFPIPLSFGGNGPPVNLSVTSIDGQRRYAGFYEKKNVGGLMVRSFLTGEQYQTFVNEQIKAKREIAYLKAYNHNGDIHYSAIFYGNINHPQVLRHGMSSSGYQREFDKWVGQGYALKMVTAAARGSNHVFAAVWQK